MLNQLQSCSKLHLGSIFTMLHRHKQLPTTELSEVSAGHLMTLAATPHPSMPHWGNSLRHVGCKEHYYQPTFTFRQYHFWTSQSAWQTSQNTSFSAMPVKTTGGPSDSNYHVKVNTTQYRQVASHLSGSTELSSGSMHHPSPTQHHIPQLHSIHTGLRWAYGIKWHYVHCTRDRTPISHVIAHIFLRFSQMRACVWGVGDQ